jgi:DNA-binding transcriptional regulator YhcF (GntR family)
MMTTRRENGKIHMMEPLSRPELPEIILNRKSLEPLHGQITRQAADAIRSGKLGRGVRLPSTRSLSLQLGVSRNIVIIVYETLAASGLIRSKPGSGAWVSNVSPVTLPPVSTLLSAAKYPERLTLLDDQDGNPLYLRHPQEHRA